MPSNVADLIPFGSPQKMRGLNVSSAVSIWAIGNAPKLGLFQLQYRLI